MALSRRSAETKTPRRRKAASRAGATTAPLYSADEKRQLILAHAAMRSPHDPLQMLSAWAGVAVVVVMVAIGWWWTSGTTLVRKAGNIGSEARELMANTPTPDFGSLMQNTSDRLRVLEAQASNQQQALEMMAALVASSTSATTSRPELFQPIATSTASSTTELNP